MDRWYAVDTYIADELGLHDDDLEEALRVSDAAGLPGIQVSAAHGKLLHVLALALGARRILEIGTLGGYSAIWLARALPPDGRLTTLEISPRHADVARSNLARAGLASVTEVVVGPALQSLAGLAEQGAGPFDLVFIDADKEGYPDYLEWSVRLSRKGTLIVADNVVRQGQVADPSNTDARVRGIRLFNERLATDGRLTATILQTVGSKGHDGLAFAVVLDPRPA
jgi:predicted O-methyltransferase YrrM